MAIFFVPTQLVTSIGSGLSAFCRGLADLLGGVRAAAAEWRRGDFCGFVDHPMDETDDFIWAMVNTHRILIMDGMTINHIVSIDHGSYDFQWIFQKF